MERSEIRVSGLVTSCFSYGPTEGKDPRTARKAASTARLRSRERGLGVVSVLPGRSPLRAEHPEVPTLALEQGDLGRGE